MEYKLPHINGYDRQEWDWPFLKFNLRRDDLFTTLHDRFNMHQLPLQDPMAFHGDVCEAIDHSGTLEEFYAQMAERRAQRVKEMNEAWANICLLIASGPWVLACPLCYDPETGEVKTPPGTLNDSMPQKWALFNYFSRSLSFDTLIRFFDGFVRDRRKKVEERRRSADKALERLRQEAAARHAAAIAKFEKTKAASQNGPEASHSQPESPKDASSPDASSDELRLSSSQRRHDTAPHPSTTASSTTRKRKSDRDTKAPQRKRRCATGESAEDDDDVVWIAAEHVRWEAEEPAPTPRKAAKRNRTGGHPHEQENKRPRRHSTSLEDESEHMHYRDSPDGRENDLSRPLSDEGEENEFLHHYEPLDEQQNMPAGTYSSDLKEKIQYARRIGTTLSRYEQIQEENCHPNFQTQWPMSPQDFMRRPTPSLDSYYTCHEATEEEKEEEGADLRHTEQDQASPCGDTERPAANDTTNKAANDEKQKKMSRALRRRRVGKRRSPEESETSPPKKQPREKKHQGRKSSTPVEQLLQSKRSSRRAAGQTLFFLADDATACVASGKRRI